MELTTGDAQIAGYAFYEGGALVRAVLINSRAFFQGDGTRPSVHIGIGFEGDGGLLRGVEVKRLAIGYATT